MGDEINRYTPPDADMGVIYPYVESADGTKPINEERLKSEYPQTYSYLSSYKELREPWKFFDELSNMVRTLPPT